MSYTNWGQQSTNWDAKAKTFFSTYAVYRYGPNSKTVIADLKRLGQELIENGCADPNVVYTYGNIINVVDGNEKALPLVQRGLELLEASKYPRIFSYYAARRLKRIYEGMQRPKDEIAAMNRKKMIYLGQAAGDAIFRNGSQRYYMEEALKERSRPDAGLMMKELKNNEGTDPWIRLVLEGVRHIDKAWQARGSGWADTVTKDGWKVFGEEMDRAEKKLVEAHELHPEFPEAACRMITVAMASCSDFNEREWFDRTVAAQLDYMSAYSGLMWALRPRWGGSHMEMYKFGVECLNTKRFDTEVPLKYWHVIRDIGSELKDWKDAYRMTGAYEHFKVLFDGMLAEPTRVGSSNYWNSFNAAVAWAAGEYKEAQRLLDELGDNVQESVFLSFGSSPALIFGDVYLRNLPIREEFEKAEACFMQDQSLDALPLFEKIAGKVKPDSHAAALIKDRIATLRINKGLLSGEWVDLVPDADLSGWEVKGGNWSVDEHGALTGASRKKDDQLMLLCRSRVKGNYEIRGEEEARFNAGVVMGYAKKLSFQYASFLIYRHTGKVVLCHGMYPGNGIEQNADLAETNRFLVQVSNNTVTAYVNDKAVFTKQKTATDWWSPHDGRIGFGSACYRYEGYNIKFRNLQIRILPGEASEKVAE